MTDWHDFSERSPDVIHVVVRHTTTNIALWHPESGKLLFPQFSGSLDPADVLNKPNHKLEWKAADGHPEARSD